MHTVNVQTRGDMANKLNTTAEAADISAEGAIAVLGGGKLYVIVEKNWNYNDSTYDLDGDGGYPQKAFFSKDAAEAHRLDLEAQRLSGLDVWAYIGDYGFEDRTDLKPEELLEKVGEIIGEEFVENIDPEDFNLTLPTLTLEQGRQLARLFGELTAGYEVVAVSVG